VKEWGLAVCEESPNSGAKRWLAGGEWAAVAYLSDGENDEKKEASASVFLFMSEERERRNGPGPTHQRRMADGFAGLAGMRRSAAPISRSDSHATRSV
jgi:hypothetical protein